MSLNRLAAECHEIAREKGWWDRERPFPEQIALMHSELSEAIESWRNGEEPFFRVDSKPEGWGVELVDCIIRILDMMFDEALDIDSLMTIKNNYNRTRPYRHGGKKI